MLMKKTNKKTLNVAAFTKQVFRASSHSACPYQRPERGHRVRDTKLRTLSSREK